MNIIILDDYQDAVRKLKCASILEHLNTKVFTNTVKGYRPALGARPRRGRAGADPRAQPVPAPAAREAPEAEAHLADRPGRAAHRPRGVHAARHRRRRRPGLAGRDRRADLGADHGGDATAAALHQHAQARCLAAVGAEGGVDAAQLRHRHGAARQDARHLGLRQDRPDRRRLRQGVRHARRRLGQRDEPPARGRRGHGSGSEPRRAVRAGRRSLAAPAPGRRDARHRQARRALAHEAGGADRQHLARRAVRGRRARLGAQPRPARDGGDRRLRGEPILQGHLLLRLENAVCTPHIGYVELDSYELLFRTAFENVVNFVKGRPTNIVNPEALKVRH